jgi:hypothetical protein
MAVPAAEMATPAAVAGAAVGAVGGARDATRLEPLPVVFLLFLFIFHFSSTFEPHYLVKINIYIFFLT